MPEVEIFLVPLNFTKILIMWNHEIPRAWFHVIFIPWSRVIPKIRPFHVKSCDHEITWRGTRPLCGTDLSCVSQKQDRCFSIFWAWNLNSETEIRNTIWNMINYGDYAPRWRFQRRIDNFKCQTWLFPTYWFRNLEGILDLKISYLIFVSGLEFSRQDHVSEKRNSDPCCLMTGSLKFHLKYTQYLSITAVQ